MIRIKANNEDQTAFSDAIDRANEGIEGIIELYNNLEDDEPLVDYEEDVAEQIEKAKIKFGAPEVNKRINTVCREMLSWLPLDDIKSKRHEEKGEK